MGNKRKRAPVVSAKGGGRKKRKQIAPVQQRGSIADLFRKVAERNQNKKVNSVNPIPPSSLTDSKPLLAALDALMGDAEAPVWCPPAPEVERAAPEKYGRINCPCAGCPTPNNNDRAI